MSEAIEPTEADRIASLERELSNALKACGEIAGQRDAQIRRNREEFALWDRGMEQLLQRLEQYSKEIESLRVRVAAMGGLDGFVGHGHVHNPDWPANAMSAETQRIVERRFHIVRGAEVPDEHEPGATLRAYLRAQSPSLDAQVASLRQQLNDLADAVGREVGLLQKRVSALEPQA